MGEWGDDENLVGGRQRDELRHVGTGCRRRGFDLLVAIDGAQGVAMAQSDAPDLILMDMSLPVMDGWEATPAQGGVQKLEPIPVIA